MRASDLSRPDHGLRLLPLEFRQPLVLPSCLDRQSFRFLFLSLDTQFLDRRIIAVDQLPGSLELAQCQLVFRLRHPDGYVACRLSGGFQFGPELLVAEMAEDLARFDSVSGGYAALFEYTILVRTEKGGLLVFEGTAIE